MDEGRFVKDPVSVFKEIKSVYEEGRACYKFTVHSSIKGSLYALARKYVQFSLSTSKTCLQLTNVHACRLYPALKSRAYSQKYYKQYPEFKASVRALRELLELKPDQYKKTYDFKRYVVEKALEDINENSDLRAWAEYLNKGRYLKAVRFHLSSKKYTVIVIQR